MNTCEKIDRYYYFIIIRCCRTFMHWRVHYNPYLNYKRKKKNQILTLSHILDFLDFFIFLILPLFLFTPLCCSIGFWPPTTMPAANTILTLGSNQNMLGQLTACTHKLIDYCFNLIPKVVTKYAWSINCIYPVESDKHY